MPTSQETDQAYSTAPGHHTGPEMLSCVIDRLHVNHSSWGKFNEQTPPHRGTWTGIQWQRLPETPVSHSGVSPTSSLENWPSLTWCTSVCWFLQTPSTVTDHWSHCLTTCHTVTDQWVTLVIDHWSHVIDWLSMVLRLHQHNIGYTADGFYRSDDPTKQCQSTEGGWLVIRTGLSLTRLTSPCYNNTTCMQILHKKII